MKLLKLTQIWIYPIKSLGGFSPPSARVLPKGFEHDRRWMLLDEDGTFMTQREHPKMALFKVSVEDDHLNVSWHDDMLSVSITPVRGAPIKTRIWDDEVSVVPVDEAFDKWFSERMDVRCRLVQFPEDNPRRVEKGYGSDDEHVRLQDAFPFLIIGQSSLNELNSRLAAPVPIDRFRPNLVFTGGDPHEEDTWGNFTIGDLPFLAAKPCARCAIPGIDQQTGIKQKEPLAELATYRRKEGKIKFGMNATGPGHGIVSTGDEISVVVAENLA